MVNAMLETSWIILRTVWQLSLYLLFGIIGIGIMIPTFFWINKSKKIKRLWIFYDRLIATMVHFTHMRTISGITGQYMNSKPRYKYQALVIDHLAYIFERQWKHCERAYRWERYIGVIK